MNLYVYKSLAESFTDVDTKKGIISGYFAAFDNIDAVGDVIRKGAFTKTIAENFNRIKHLENHDTRKPVAKILELKEDAKGLAYVSQIGTHKDGKDFAAKVESGLITEHSVGYRTVKELKQKGYNEVKEVQLWEGSSLTHWGVNPNTPITSYKGMTDEDYLTKLMERTKQLDSFCRNSDASDETIQLLLLEHKQLTQTIADLYAKINTKPSTETLPFDSVKAAETINNFINKLNS
jgi:HK97 family phage prohead protease